jgi:hypothetical protein
MRAWGNRRSRREIQRKETSKISISPIPSYPEQAGAISTWKVEVPTIF